MNNDDDDDACAQLKQWISSLTWTALQDAMEWVLELADDEDARHLANLRVHTPDALILEMIRCQTPLPTPINKDAIGKIAASCALDGRNEVERIARDRIHRPRLFKWSVDHSYTGAASSRSSKRSSSSSSSSSSSTPRYELRHRTFVTPAGDRWSIPPTEALRMADAFMTQRTVFWVANAPGGGGGARQRRKRWVVRLQSPSLSSSSKTKNEQNVCVKSILRLLRTASRGYFLSMHVPWSQKMSLLPPWMCPTEDWFSLPVHLVARFEMALWQSFYQARRRKAQQLPPTTPAATIPSCSSWREQRYAVMHLLVTQQERQPQNNGTEEEEHPAAVAVKRALVRLLQQESKATSTLRDGTLWKLLLDEEARCWIRWLSHDGLVNKDTINQKSLDAIVLDTLWCCPLMQIGSASDHLRQSIHEEVYHLLAQQAERELLSMDNGMATGTGASFSTTTTTKTTTTTTTTTTSKRRKKRKGKKRGGGGRPRPTLEPILDVIEPVQEIEEEEEENEKQAAVADVDARSTLEFPLNEAISARDRNRHKVMALAILDNVIKDVFDAVGLEPDKDDSNQEQGISANVKETQSTSLGAGQRNEKEAGENQNLSNPKNEDAKIEEVDRSKLALADNIFSVQEDQNEDHSRPLDEATTAAIEIPLMANRRTFGAFSSPYEASAGGFYVRPDSVDLAWDGHDFSLYQHHWGKAAHESRDHSIMEEFFLSQEHRQVDPEENIMVSSTMASIASSAEASNSDHDVVDDVEHALGGATDHLEERKFDVVSPENAKHGTAAAAAKDQEIQVPEKPLLEAAKADPDRIPPDSTFDSRSPSPHAPSTPSPRLSPILVSLADLQEMRIGSIERANLSDTPKAHSVRSFSSVPGVGRQAQVSPNLSSPRPRIVTSLSRDNLRASVSSDERDARRSSPANSMQASRTSGSDMRPMQRASSVVRNASKLKSRDDNDIRSKGSLNRRGIDALESYRNAAARSLKSRDDHDIRQVRATPPRSTSHRTESVSRGIPLRPTPDPARTFAAAAASAQQQHFHFDASETARDRLTRSEVGNDDFPALQATRRISTVEDGDNNTVTRDGSTTITSAALSNRETDETLREERNNFRDLCLTLGAEVAKLKNMLASQKGSAVYPHMEYNPAQSLNLFDPESVTQFNHNPSRPQTLAAMSDAGFRGGEHASLTSEDDVAVGKTQSISRHLSSAATATGSALGSDASIEYGGAHHLNVTVGVPMMRETYDPIHLSGVQSRLTADIMAWFDNTNGQLRKLDAKRAKAVERMTRLVNTVWPRAQVKLYGSHATGLCLPSSDVDFVICLPAVHKNAPAVAPGALEGRNAVNETSQKLLARKLKSESWIDPRSMKVIERTLVPVIKVATKDLKAKTIQLDITFDGPRHHGLDAAEMVSAIVEELPMIRPLVLVLKQFLLDRGLLTAFSGGLSSYCLFLMMARYLQEQASSWGDCGSLLMGFLDFYGNHFDPRLTGISVRNRQYFARPNYATARMQHASQQPMWAPKNPPLGLSQAPMADRSLSRRNSFSDKGSLDGARGGPMSAGPLSAALPRIFHPTGTPPVLNRGPANAHAGNGSMEHGMPYTFDPLFVEDPLSQENNVGRNTFRIFQVQRAFSDAHRALVAALEWDMQSTGDLQEECEYPLLKCLLQTEDLFFDL